MLFSCSVEYRATPSGALFGQFQKVNSAKFTMTKLSEAHCSVGPRHVWTLGSIKTLWHTIMRRRG